MNQFNESTRPNLLNEINNRSSFTSMFDAGDWAIAIVIMLVFTFAMQVVNN